MTAGPADTPVTAEKWIEYLRETEGDEYVEEHRALIDAQLRLMGYLPAGTTGNGDDDP